MLHPHISTLLEGSDWDYWRGKLDGLSYREDAMQEVGLFISHSRWKAETWLAILSNQNKSMSRQPARQAGLSELQGGRRAGGGPSPF